MSAIRWRPSVAEYVTAVVLRTHGTGRSSGTQC